MTIILIIAFGVIFSVLMLKYSSQEYNGKDF